MTIRILFLSTKMTSGRNLFCKEIFKVVEISFDLVKHTSMKVGEDYVFDK